MEAIEPVVERRQFRLGEMFGWFVICGSLFTIVASSSMVSRVLLQQEPISGARVLPPSVCWLILLAYYVRRRHYAAVLAPLFCGLPAALFVGLIARWTQRNRIRTDP